MRDDTEILLMENGKRKGGATCGFPKGAIMRETPEYNQPSQSKPIGFMVSSIVCSVIALGFFPPIFGGLAIFLGYQAYKRDTGIGQVCMVIAGIALIVGIIIGALWGMENIQF
jgi:hypothetical protein